ncbi:MAG TPA: hypothetical protein VKN99_14785 [Polyangia bacterium]|nr:hypothetical protein [Polyangia bacterium]
MWLLSAAACASSPTPGPRDALGSYAEAVRGGDYDRAYALMSAEYRRRTGRDEFVKFLKDNSSDVQSAAERLRAGARDVELRAHVEYGQGERLGLVYEAGAWRLTEDPLDLFGQRTPREALRSFVRAVERKRYDVVLRFVPKRWREMTTTEKLRESWEGPQREEIEKLVRNLRAHLQDPIQEEGDEARMPYGGGFAVKFVREEGLWRIQDPD